MKIDEVDTKAGLNKAFQLAKDNTQRIVPEGSEFDSAIETLAGVISEWTIADEYDGDPDIQSAVTTYIRAVVGPALQHAVKRKMKGTI